MRRRAGLLLLAVLLLAGCHPADIETSGGFGGKDYAGVVKELCAGRIGAGERVGVGGFYDGSSGDYTALGDLWRDRAETALAESGFSVVAVRDLGLVIEVLEQRHPALEESQIWHRAAGRYLLVGRYYLYPARAAAKKKVDFIELELKLLDTAQQAVIGAQSFRTRLTPGWQRQAAVVRGNVYQQAVAGIGPKKKENGPRLAARLDRKVPCYPAGAEVHLAITTEPGVHLYILNIAADDTVTLDLPNRYLPDRPLAAGNFAFPPPDLPHLKLLLYPLAGERTSREAFKIIASRTRLDFSFLKVPEGRIFAGAEAAELKKVLAVLEQALAWSEVTLPYRVGAGCE